MKYPNKCCRCGMCCLSGVCPAGLARYGIKHDDQKQRCPGLMFDGDKSSCQIALQSPALMEDLGMGAGCCIKARVISPDRVVAFEELPDKTKIIIAQKVRYNQIAQA